MGLHTAFYKTMLTYLNQMGALVDVPFQGNPDYQAFFALFTGAPVEGNLLSNEATYGGYARFRSVRNPYHWAMQNGPPAFVSQINDLHFGTPTSGAGQVITHWAFLYPNTVDSSYSIVVSGPLSNPLTVALGVPILFPAGEIQVVVPG